MMAASREKKMTKRGVLERASEIKRKGSIAPLVRAEGGESSIQRDPPYFYRFSVDDRVPYLVWTVGFRLTEYIVFSVSQSQLTV